MASTSSRCDHSSCRTGCEKAARFETPGSRLCWFVCENIVNCVESVVHSQPRYRSAQALWGQAQASTYPLCSEIKVSDATEFVTRRDTDII